MNSTTYPQDSVTSPTSFSCHTIQEDIQETITRALEGASSPDTPPRIPPVRSRAINGDGVRCILDAVKIMYCFRQMTSLTNDLSMGLMSIPI